MKTISDNHTLLILNIIDTGDYNSNGLMQKVRITRKHYYIRISNLLRVGLIKRIKGYYRITLFGRIISTAINEIEYATDMEKIIQRTKMLVRVTLKI
jgi:DNA-binding HxlR family transcriptional regulator